MKLSKSGYRNEITLKDVNNDMALLEFCRQGNFYCVSSRQIIMEENNPADRIYLLIDGSIQVYITDEKDHELVLTYLTGLNFFGEMGYLAQERLRTASVRARTDVKLVEMSYAQFDDFTKKHPEVLLTLCRNMAMRLKYTSQQMSSMAFDDVQDRVIETIFTLARMPDAMTHPDGIQIRTTRQEIGNILGCSRETVGRVIKVLEEKNVLITRGKTIIVRIDY